MGFFVKLPFLFQNIANKVNPLQAWVADAVVAPVVACASLHCRRTRRAATVARITSLPVVLPPLLSSSLFLSLFSFAWLLSAIGKSEGRRCLEKVLRGSRLGLPTGGGDRVGRFPLAKEDWGHSVGSFACVSFTVGWSRLTVEF